MASNQAGYSPIRKITASGRTWSLKKQAQMADSTPKIETVKQQVSAYEIDWADLKEFLEKRFPKFPSELLVEDVGYVPGLSLFCFHSDFGECWHIFCWLQY
jgi:hypothetical protein